MIEAGARAALGDLKAGPALRPRQPCEVKVEFKHTAAADKLRFHPGVERLDGRTIRVEADTWWGKPGSSSSLKPDVFRSCRKATPGVVTTKEGSS